MNGNSTKLVDYLLYILYLLWDILTSNKCYISRVYEEIASSDHVHAEREFESSSEEEDDEEEITARSSVWKNQVLRWSSVCCKNKFKD